MNATGDQGVAIKLRPPAAKATSREGTVQAAHWPVLTDVPRPAKGAKDGGGWKVSLPLKEGRLGQTAGVKLHEAGVRAVTPVDGRVLKALVDASDNHASIRQQAHLAALPVQQVRPQALPYAHRQSCTSLLCSAQPPACRATLLPPACAVQVPLASSAAGSAAAAAASVAMSDGGAKKRKRGATAAEMVTEGEEESTDEHEEMMGAAAGASAGGPTQPPAAKRPRL